MLLIVVKTILVIFTLVAVALISKDAYTQMLLGTGDFNEWMVAEIEKKYGEDKPLKFYIDKCIVTHLVIVSPLLIIAMFVSNPVAAEGLAVTSIKMTDALIKSNRKMYNVILIAKNEAVQEAAKKLTFKDYVRLVENGIFKAYCNYLCKKANCAIPF